MTYSGWWLNQPIWKILYSQIASFPQIGMNLKKNMKPSPSIQLIPKNDMCIFVYLDVPNDAKCLLFQKLLLFWGTCIFFCLRAFFGFGTFWGTWTSHHGADKHLKRRNFPSKKRNFPPKKRKNKSGWQAFPSSQNPKHETALFLEKSKKYPKQQKKVLFQLRAIISHNRKFQVYLRWMILPNYREGLHYAIIRIPIQQPVLVECSFEHFFHTCRVVQFERPDGCAQRMVETWSCWFQYLLQFFPTKNLKVNRWHFLPPNKKDTLKSNWTISPHRSGLREHDWNHHYYV